MKKYFCDSCGFRFESDNPDELSISCPDCGCWDIYPDTPEGAAASVKARTEYENTQIAWEDEN